MTQEQQSPFTILVPLDGSPRAVSALPVAGRLSQLLKGELALIQVVPVVMNPMIIEPGYVAPETYQQMYDDQERLAREDLERLAAPLRVQGLVTRTVVQRGEAATCVIDAVTTLHVGLVVMTSHGRTGLARFALGSVADRVTRTGVAPVLLLRSFAGAAPTEPHVVTLRHALVPLDGSLLAESALDTVGARLAGAVISEFTLLRVVDPRDGAEGIRIASEYLAGAQRRFRQRLQEQGIQQDVAVTTSTPVGAPAASILAAASERQCDFILMSTRGEAGIGRLAFGSVADRIIRDGALPTLFVHPPVG